MTIEVYDNTNTIEIIDSETTIEVGVGFITTSGGIQSVDWGDIDGDIADQSDLKQSLDLKADKTEINNYFKGLFSTFFDLTVAHPTASAGDYAQVDFGLGEDVIIYAWDVSDQYWSAVGVVSIANTDALPEGSVNLYFTETRVRGVTISTLSIVNSAITSLDTIVSAFGKLQGQINNKENLITSGVAGQYLSHDKTFKVIDYSEIANRIVSTDGLPEGATNLYYTPARVRSTPLTGLSLDNNSIVATDNVLQAFGKTQAQINTLSNLVPQYIYSFSNNQFRNVGTTLNANISAFGSDIVFPAGFLQLNDVIEIDIGLKVAGATSGAISMRLGVNGATPTSYMNLTINGITTRFFRIKSTIVVDYQPNDAATNLLHMNNDGSTIGTFVDYTAILSTSDPTQALTLNFRPHVTTAFNNAGSEFAIFYASIRVKRYT